ncbi:Arginine ABC transporter permease protein ArtM [Cedecea neteri]|uniref:Arginine ABC transporter permease protein ArtM n=1 Tax=Cedecea neteri TaxID=158822 RepID=A0A2X3IXH0_9ENTR|nr:Arginine ABC transporter permease protein ArtM [Cedecea neteri]
MTLPLLLLRMSRWAWPKRFISAYVALFQGTPLLMQLFLAFFGIALFGIDVSPWTAATLALTLFTSAFLLDIWYGSIRALPQRPMGSLSLPRFELRADAVPGNSPAGNAHRRCADGRVFGAGD